MAWTATLSSKRLVDGVAVLTVAFADDVTGQRFDEQVRVSNAQGGTFLSTHVRNRITQLNQMATWVASLTEGAITPAADEVPTAPTAEELARAAWSRNYQRLLAWQRAVSVGLESPTDPLYTNLQAQVLADKLNAYRTLY